MSVQYNRSKNEERVYMNNRSELKYMKVIKATRF